jgi:hypothetical protein
LAVVDSSRPEHHMSNSAAAVQVERRGRAPGRGGPAGALVLGDYVGQSAAHAAQAVRRAGLRPGLDRSFGCDPGLTGTVVAQDPPAGSDLARNAMVTLYVAAPGPTQAQETGEPGIQASDQPEGPLSPADSESAKAVASSFQPGARRPRKPGLGAATRTVEEPPEPITAPHHVAGGQEAIATEWDARAGVEEPRLPVLEEATFDDTHGHMRPEDVRSVHLEDIFAGRIRELPPWRRAYPRRPIATMLRRPLAWAGSHRIVSITAVAMLAVWIAVAVAGGLAGQATRTRGAGVTAERGRIATNRRATSEPAPARTRTQRRRTHGSTRTHARPRRPRSTRQVRRSRWIAQRTRRTAQTSGASAGSSTSAPRSLPAGAVSGPSSPAPKQTNGGPFSP